MYIYTYIYIYMHIKIVVTTMLKTSMCYSSSGFKSIYCAKSRMVKC